MRWTSRTVIFVAPVLGLAVASCGGTSPPAPLKFSTAPAALVYAGVSSEIPIRVSDPSAKISEIGPLPSGMSFHAGSGGTAAIAGTLGGDAGGSYQVRLTAVDGVRHVSQDLTLSVNENPYFPSIDSTTFGANEYHGNTDVIVATGYPMPQLSCSGTLPSGFTCEQTGIGVITISGSPGTFETPCSSQITVLASSSYGTAKLPVTIKIGDWLCFYNVAGSWVGKIGGVIIGESGEWLWKNGKKAGAWVWEHGRAFVKQGGAVAAESDDE